MGTPEQVRCEVLFRGHVQGVGFRFTTLNVAKNYPVTGYVMNLPDGTVRMVAEAPKPIVMDLIRSVENAMKGHVRDRSESWGPATGEFPDFSVRYRP